MPLLLLLCALTLAQSAPDAAADAPVTEFRTINPADCSNCHPDEGHSGHAPPKLLGCKTCHTPGEATRPIAPSTRQFWSADTVHYVMPTPNNATCQGCHEEEYQTIEHPEVLAGNCLTCHDPHDRSSNTRHLAGKPDSVVCLKCHEKKEGAFIHTIVKRGVCSACHLVHGSEQEALLKGDQPASSCIDCHERPSKKVKHNPADQGDCMACHDAHGSDHEHNLIVAPTDVCFQCHPPLKHRKQVHSAVELGHCTGCHDSHGSDNNALLRADPISGACFRCHADDISGRKWVHKPVEAGNCTICHAPHSGNYAQSLRAPALLTCAACHPDEYRPKVMTPHQAVLADGCPACHDPHASNNDLGLKAPPMELCTACHPGYEDGYHAERTVQGKGHPMGNGVRDPLVEGRELTCISCHDPHGSDNPAMWYRSFQRMALCVECHRDSLAGGTEPGQSDFEISSERARERYLERKQTETSRP